VIFALLAACAGAGMGAATDGRPNLLVVHTDEHNFRTLGCYRALLSKEQAHVWGAGVAVETPHIDALAARGALCDRFYAASPVCTPSRASFVTGRYPQNTGAAENDRPLRDDVVTFAEALRRQGYATGYAGKWHLDGPAKPGWAPARTFGFEDNRYLFNRGHWKQFEDTAAGPAVKARKPNGDPTYGVAGADEKSFATDFLADQAVAFVKANKGRPFCYMVSFPDPHGPNAVRPPYDTLYEKLAFRLPASAEGRGRLENMARYFGMVRCIDDNVGKIVEGLREAGVLEKTVVVFTADHGDMCGEHGLNNKGVPYEASARVPFIVAYPGAIKPGTVVREALGTVDFKPTVLGLLGLPRDAQDEGRDASALLLAGRAPDGWEDVAFSRNSGGSWLMAVSRSHKLVVFRDAPPALYDLARDPLETHNLFAEPAARETVRGLARALAAYAKRCQEPHAEQPSLRADLTWAAEGTGAYTPPVRAKPKAKGMGGRKAGGDGEE
jgi:arylsulfatase A-like enzyme